MPGVAGTRLLPPGLEAGADLVYRPPRLILGIALVQVVLLDDVGTVLDESGEEGGALLEVVHVVAHGGHDEPTGIPGIIEDRGAGPRPLVVVALVEHLHVVAGRELIDDHPSVPGLPHAGVPGQKVRYLLLCRVILEPVMDILQQVEAFHGEESSFPHPFLQEPARTGVGSGVVGVDRVAGTEDMLVQVFSVVPGARPDMRVVPEQEDGHGADGEAMERAGAAEDDSMLPALEPAHHLLPATLLRIVDDLRRRAGHSKRHVTIALGAEADPAAPWVGEGILGLTGDRQLVEKLPAEVVQHLHRLPAPGPSGPIDHLAGSPAPVRLGPQGVAAGGKL